MSRQLGHACSRAFCLVVDSCASKSATPTLTRFSTSFSDHSFLPSSCANAFAPTGLIVSFTPRRTFCVSRCLAKLQPWDKRKYPGRKPRALGRAVTKLELVDPDPTLDAEEEKIVAQWNAQYDVRTKEVAKLLGSSIFGWLGDQIRIHPRFSSQRND